MIKIELPPTFRKQLRTGVLTTTSSKFLAKAISNAPAISKLIGDMLVKHFNNSEVARSLRGSGVEDLPAHFGQKTETMASMADGMAELIRKSVKFSFRTVGLRASVMIMAVERDWNEYLNLHGAEYVSHPSNIIIPVMRWLLLDPNIDVGQAAYDIVFSGDYKGKFNATIQKASRSGRAIMVSLEKLGGTGGYVLPAIVSGGLGENFIEMTLRQKGVAQEAADIFMKRII